MTAATAPSPIARTSSLANAREAVTMALDTLRTNRLRSGLTVLGIVIGVMTVILISSVIDGLNTQVSGLVSSLGTNVIWIFRFPVIGVRPTTEMLARKQLTYDDMVAISQLPHVTAAAASLRYANLQFQTGSSVAKYGTKKAESLTVAGDTVSMAEVNEVDMKAGRYFTTADQERAADVVVLGADTATTLFGAADPLGQTITVEGRAFTVVGVFTKFKDAFGGGGQNPRDNTAYLPITTFHKLHPEVLDYWLSVKFDDQANRGLVEDGITELLRRRRHVRNEAEDNFAIFGSDSITRLWTEITGSLFLLMFGLSAVGLMVGGVGVMNVMLVSVTERTREIGVRKAVGATRASVLLQFTLEAVTLCALGGLIGVALGGLLAWGLSFVIPARLNPLWAAIALFGSSAIGLVFGIYPAWKAATLNPIDALRYE